VPRGIAKTQTPLITKRKEKTMSKNDEIVIVTIEFTEFNIRRGEIEIEKSKLDACIDQWDKGTLIELALDASYDWHYGVDYYAPVFVHPDGEFTKDTIEIF
jgi:hypothetical protein